MSEPARATVKYVDGMQFVGQSGTGHAFVMDAAPGVGGENSGPRPMELLLVGVGGCTAMDVVSILRKKKLDVRGFQVNVKGNWVEGENTYPKFFKDIEIEYVVTGKGISDEAVKRAISLSEEKYCSVMANLRGVSKITTSYRIINE
ncbi:MAG: OsmC family protein [Nitrospirota bacterium]